MADENQHEQGRTGTAGTITPIQPEPTLSGEPLKDLSEGDTEPRASIDPAEAVKAAADPAVTRNPKALDERAVSAATAWFVDADEAVASESEIETKTLEINWGDDDNPDRMNWTVKAVDGDLLRAIRKRESLTKEARRTGIPDEYSIQLQVIVAGTVDPDMAEAAKMRSAQTGERITSLDMVRRRFKKRPGFVPQIATHIMRLSGFDDESITEQDQVTAAGNS